MQRFGTLLRERSFDINTFQWKKAHQHLNSNSGGSAGQAPIQNSTQDYLLKT